MKKNNSEFIYTKLNEMFPNAHCELQHRNEFEMLIAVVLSAQTTDKKVNEISSKLFDKYPNPYLLSEAKISDVEHYIKTIGLYHNKAKNIISLSKALVESYDGKVPNKMEELVKLAGVGRKSANVVLSECFSVPAIAVDTHVARVAKRLKIAKTNDDVNVIENKLRKYFPIEQWSRLHHLMIFFGRYKCFARKPDCEDCPFFSICSEHNK